MPDRIDVYYGMADNRIGVARLDVPERLPSGAPADRAANQRRLLDVKRNTDMAEVSNVGADVKADERGRAEKAKGPTQKVERSS